MANVVEAHIDGQWRSMWECEDQAEAEAAYRAAVAQYGVENVRALRPCTCGKYDVCFRLSMTGDCPKVKGGAAWPPSPHIEGAGR